jgi:hypothetical protein
MRHKDRQNTEYQSADTKIMGTHFAASMPIEKGGHEKTNQFGYVARTLKKIRGKKIALDNGIKCSSQNQPTC